MLPQIAKPENRRPLTDGLHYFTAPCPAVLRGHDAAREGGAMAFAAAFGGVWEDLPIEARQTLRRHWTARSGCPREITDSPLIMLDAELFDGDRVLARCAGSGHVLAFSPAAVMVDLDGTIRHELAHSYAHATGEVAHVERTSNYAIEEAAARQLRAWGHVAESPRPELRGVKPAPDWFGAVLRVTVLPPPMTRDEEIRRVRRDLDALRRDIEAAAPGPRRRLPPPPAPAMTRR